MLRVCVFLRLPYISAAQLRLGACAEGHIDRAMPICDMRCMQFCASAANLSTRMHLTPFDARGGHPFAALGASHNPPGGRGTGKVGADGDGKSDPGSVDAAPAPSSQVGLGRVEPCGASSHQDSTSFVRFCQISTQLPRTGLRCID